jgi:hypothetical protein
MSAGVVGSRSPRRANQRRTRRCTVRPRASASRAPRPVALVKPDSPLDVTGDHTVEGQQVVVVVRVERAPETLREGDGSELRVAKRGWSTWTRLPERRPEGPQEDGEHGTRHLGRQVQEGTEPLGHGKHPLPDREMRNHRAGEVGRHLRHASGVAGRADAATLAGEGQEPFMPAVRAPHPREPVSQDAAPQIASEVSLHPRRDPPAQGVGVLRLGEEGLQVMLDHRVEGRLGGAAGAIDGPGGTIRRRCGEGRPSAGGLGGGWGMRSHLPSHPKSMRRAMAGSARLSPGSPLQSLP